MQAEPDRYDRFVKALVALEAAADGGRAARAALRRGLGKRPGTAADMYPYVVPHLPANLYPDQENAYYLVASLFGFHPRHEQRPGERPRNLGDALYLVGQQTNPQSTERRFMALLNVDRDDLDTHLRHLIALLKGQELSLDYAQLLRDVLAWNLPDRRVQKRWARSYWAPRTTAEDTSPAA